MRIFIMPENVLARDTCVLCGNAFVPSLVGAYAIFDDGARTKVCDECAQSGSGALQTRIHSHAANLRTQAERLEQIATGPIELLDMKAFIAIRDQIEAELVERTWFDEGDDLPF